MNGRTSTNVYGCQTYADWLRETLFNGDIHELRRGRRRA